MPSTDVTIVGAGSWGRALAHTLLINKKKILMYSRNTKDKKYECNNINVLHTNEIQNVFSITRNYTDDVDTDVQGKLRC